MKENRITVKNAFVPPPPPTFVVELTLVEARALMHLLGRCAGGGVTTDLYSALAGTREIYLWDGDTPKNKAAQKENGYSTIRLLTGLDFTATKNTLPGNIK